MRPRSSYLELPQKPHIVLIKDAEIIELHAALHDSRSFHAPAERETGEFLGIEPCGLEHVRMEHPGAAEFEPAALARAALLAVRTKTGAVADPAGDVELRSEERRVGK